MDPHGGPAPHPAYGFQLNPQAIPGVPPEGEAVLAWETQEIALADGRHADLHRPKVGFRDLHYGPIGADVPTSLRNAPPLIGLGLLEAVPETAILALAQNQKHAGGAVHGHPNLVWDEEAQKLRLGRFGQKANQPSLKQQIAGAFVEDLGLTSRLYPQETCTDEQFACRAAGSHHPELADAQLDAIVTSIRAAAVPARRKQDDDEVKRGEVLFHGLGCATCHAPSLPLGESAPQPRLIGQTIHPYTDLLVHDMGGGLADGRADFQASGSEWRTPPLWGLGLSGLSGESQNYLHDGRANSLEEALLWHGGEALQAREAFRSLDRSSREALLSFLNSL
jgi:CxxC motif-containing protein (DUF1111 family)